MPVINMPFWDVSLLVCQGRRAGFTLTETAIDYEDMQEGEAAASWIFFRASDATYWKATGRICVTDGVATALPDLQQVERKEKTIVVETWEAV